MKGLMQAFPLTLDLVMRRALELGGDTDVVSSGPTGVVRHTWREVAGRALRLGAGLDGLGVPRGAVIATFAWNSHRHVELMLGVPCSGRTVHPVNVRLWPEDAVRLMARTGDAVLFVDASLTGLLAALADRLPMATVVVMDDGAEPDPAFAAALRYEALLAESEPLPPGEAGVAEDDAAWICHTSGTTGDPKAVVASHRSAVLHSFSSMMVDSHGISERDTVLPVTPIFHANAWGLPYTTALAVSRLVLPGRDTSAAALARLIETERVTVAAGVPTVFDRLLADAGASADWASLRRILCGGAPVPTALARRFAERGLEVFQGWGMTEMSPSGSANIVRSADGVASATAAIEGEGSILRAGKATAGVELRLVADDGRVLPWDGESVGEVEARGAWVISAYLDPDDDANTTRFDDGWLRTGDLGRMAPDGTLEIVDRVKDLVKSGGEWISSLSLERALLQHPRVAQAVVVAMPDERWGERPAAFIVAGSEAPEPDELRGFLATRVPRWWVPDFIRIVERLPLTPVGKYDKRRLRDELAAGAGSAERAEHPHPSP